MFNNICFDVETGGFNCEVNPITEFACIVYNPITFEKLFEFESIIKPYNGLVLDDGATKVTGLNYDKCMDEGIDAKELFEVMQYIFEHYCVHQLNLYLHICNNHLIYVLFYLAILILILLMYQLKVYQ